MNFESISHDDIKSFWSREDMWGGTNLGAVNPFKYDGEYCKALNNVEVNFYAVEFDGQLVGCNSFYSCLDRSVRSRGLYVLPEYRKFGLATQLLLHGLQNYIDTDTEYVWSKPRVSAVGPYKAAGFIITSDEFTTNPDGSPTLWPNVMARYDT